MRLRNKGGSWRRSNGSLVLRNEVFEPNAQEFARLEIRQLIGSRFEVLDERWEVPDAGRAALQEAPAADVPASIEPDSAETTNASSETTSEPSTGQDETPVKAPPPAGWPLKMAPDVYLRLHPEGQYAALARQYVTTEE